MSRQGIPACYDTGVEASARWPPTGRHCSTQWWTGGVAPVDCLAETPSWCIFFFGWRQKGNIANLWSHVCARKANSLPISFSTRGYGPWARVVRRPSGPPCSSAPSDGNDTEGMKQNFYGTDGIFKNFMALKGEASILVALKELALVWMDKSSVLNFSSY